MDIFKMLIIIIIIVAISIILTLCFVVEDFIFMDHNSYKTHLAVNPYILNHSFIIPDSEERAKIESDLLQIVCKNKNELMKNKIKYIEGMSWSKWITDTKNSNDIAKQVYHYINNKLSKKIIYYTLNKYKYSAVTYDHVLLDLDFIFYKGKGLHASHFKIICVVNLVSKSIHMLFVKVVGLIHEDFIYENNENVSNKFKHVDYNPVSFDIQTSCQDMANEDKYVEDLIYSKLMNEDVLEDQNNTYYLQQKNVKNAFFAENCRSKPKTNNIYKNYPYSHDFNLRAGKKS